VGGAWASALGAAALVAAVLSVAGAAPVAIDTPEQWADAREVLNVFSGMFLGYFAVLIVPSILTSLLIGRFAPAAADLEARVPWLVGILFALVSLADVALTVPGESVPSLRARASSLAIGLAASLGAAMLVRLVLRGPLRAAGAALGATAILGGVGALIAVVWLRGLEAGTVALVAGCALTGGAALAGVAAAAAVVPRLAPARRRQVNVALVGLFALVLVVSRALARQTPGSREADSTPANVRAAGQPAAAGQPNVVLISIDTLRADRLSCYGNPRRTSPSLDALAAEGVRFEHAFATSSWTLPAHASMLTGLYPATHQADRSWAQSGNHLIDPLDPAVPTLAGILSGRGWRTGGFVSNPMVSSVFGIHRGFDEYHDGIDRLGRFLNFRDSLYWRAMLRAGLWQPRDFDGEVKVDEFLPEVLSWVDAHAGERFFLFAHFMEPHYIYEPPGPYRLRADGSAVPISRDIEPLISGRYMLPESGLADMRLLYDGEIAWLDSRLKSLLDRLDRDDLRGRTLVIVTSDHGESIGERGLFTHGSALTDEQIRVPLILRLPGVLPSGTVVTQGLVSQVDLLPSILDLLGLTPPEGIQGRSMRPLWSGGDPAAFDSVYAELRADIGWKKINPTLGHRLEMLRTADSKLVLVDGALPRLFLLDGDPGETHDRAGSDSARTGDLLRALEERRRKITPAGAESRMELDPEILDQLKTLGYVQ